jgi:copper oxidase (laccase) domain-containing protein
VIYDKKQQILAFSHLGWQSIELNLHKKLVNKLINDYNSKIEDLIIHIGPSIKADSYILESPSQLKFEEWKPYLLNTKDNYYRIDLNGYLLSGLLEMGIKDNQISNSTIDTAKNMEYFSHYRCTYIDKNEEEGRFVCGTGMI